MRLLRVLACAALVICLTPAVAGAFSVNLDRDPAVERVDRVTAAVRFPAAVVTGSRWVVRDHVAGERVSRPLGPAHERSLRPRLGDRNANGLRDLLITSIAGNSIFDTRIVEWDGRRTRTPWVLPTSQAFWDRALPPGAEVVGTRPPRFPAIDDAAARAIEVDAYDAECPACRPRAVYTVRWEWSPPRGRWLFAGSRGVMSARADGRATVAPGH